MNRRLTSLVLFLAAAVVIVPPAWAGTYEVSGCDTRAVSGWSPQAAGPFNGYGDTCAGGGWLSLHNLIGSPGGASWRFDAPPGTDIAGFRVQRSYRLAAGVPWGTMVYRLETYGSGDRYRDYLPNFGGTPVAADLGWEGASGLTGQTALVVALECGGGLPCTAPGGEVAITATRVTLRDANAPSIAAVTGGPAQSGPLRGRETLAYAARDEGGGLWRAELLVDGAVMGGGAVDGDDGRCAPPFRHVVPCRGAASQTLELDTTRVADGRHTLELRVLDAAGNEATWRRTVTVANATPAGSAPTADPPAPRTGDPAAAARITAWLERGRRRATTATAPYGERVRIRGRITDPDGRPLTGTALEMTERLIDATGRPLRNDLVARGARHNDLVARDNNLVARGRTWPAVTGVRVRPDGRFTTFTRVGPSRRIGIVGPGGSRAPRLTLRVRAAVSVRLTRLDDGALARGRVRGSHVPRGTLVELQTRGGARWATRLVVRTRALGRFAGRLPAGEARVRARVPRQRGLPYVAGSAITPPRTAGRTGPRTSR
jgi:hypothetical protein